MKPHDRGWITKPDPKSPWFITCWFEVISWIAILLQSMHIYQIRQVVDYSPSYLPVSKWHGACSLMNFCLTALPQSGGLKGAHCSFCAPRPPSGLIQPCLRKNKNKLFLDWTSKGTWHLCVYLTLCEPETTDLPHWSGGDRSGIWITQG